MSTQKETPEKVEKMSNDVESFSCFLVAKTIDKWKRELYNVSEL